MAGGLHDHVIDQTVRLVHFRAGSLRADPLDRRREGKTRGFAVSLACLVAMLTLGCGNAYAPAEAALLARVSLEPALVRQGDSVRVLLEYMNPSYVTIDVAFPNECTFGFEIRDTAEVVVGPPGYDCFQAPTTVTMPPREWLAFPRYWTGGSRESGGTAFVPPGTYRVYAGLDTYPFRTLSEPVTIEVIER